MRVIAFRVTQPADQPRPGICVGIGSEGPFEVTTLFGGGFAAAVDQAVERPR